VTQTFNIGNVTPKVIISAPASGTVIPVGTTLNFKAMTTDTLGDTPRTATWSFDTTTKVLTSPIQNASGESDLSTTFTFTTAGVYKIKLTVVDGVGGTSGTGIATQVDGLDALVVVYDPTPGSLPAVDGSIHRPVPV